MLIPPTIKNSIENLLGRKFQLLEHESVESFLEFSEDDLKELRFLDSRNSVLAIAYIGYRLKGAPSLGIAASYCENVIRKKIPIERWIEANKEDLDSSGYAKKRGL